MVNLAVVVALPAELDGLALPFPSALSGVGKVNAALTTARLIDELRPDLVVNYGTAGGVSCTPGQLVEVGTVFQRDADCEPLAPRGMLLDDVATFVSGHPGVRCGSGDSFVRSVDAWLGERCDIVDMELWGVTKACAARGVPWRSVKWITDAADEDAAAAWQANCSHGARALLAWLEALR